MKKSIILLAALLALVGCAVSNTKRTTYCSCYESNSTPMLDSFGLTESYKLDTKPMMLRSHQQLREKDDNEIVFFDNYQSVVTFANELEQKVENGNYQDTITALRAINEEDFQNKNLLLTYEISLGSGGYNLYFDAVYLKEGTLYIHGFQFDKNSVGASGIVFTMDIVYVASYVWLDKDVTFTESKVICDQDERIPMIVELD